MALIISPTAGAAASSYFTLAAGEVKRLVLVPPTGADFTGSEVAEIETEVNSQPVRIGTLSARMRETRVVVIQAPGKYRLTKAAGLTFGVDAE